MNLAAYIHNRLSAAGYTPNDVSQVQWRHPDFDSLGEDGWVTVDRGRFVAVASRVDVGDVTPDARERLRFHIVTNDAEEATFQWSNAAADFVKVGLPPRIYVLNQSDLT